MLWWSEAESSASCGEADGQPDQAYAVLAGCWDWYTKRGDALEYRVLGPDLIRLALASGDPQRAQTVAAASPGSPSRTRSPR